MASTTTFKCVSHQAEIQIETWQSHSSSNVPNNVTTNIQSHITNSNELIYIYKYSTHKPTYILQHWAILTIINCHKVIEIVHLNCCTNSVDNCNFSSKITQQLLVFYYHYFEITQEFIPLHDYHSYPICQSINTKQKEKSTVID